MALLSGTALGLCAAPMLAFALPQGGVVSGGAAGIRSAGGSTTIHQYTDRAVVDWQSFDIQNTESVTFAQPSTGAAILNRIHDTDASRIDGALTANGQVYLVNPNGMVFGKGAQVDVGSLVATTADTSNADFMKGGAVDFNKPGKPDAQIINQGTITVKEGGLAALVAPQVANSGIITAKAGTVTLAGAETATVDFYGDELLSFTVPKATSGTMDTAQASAIVDGVVNTSGIVLAETLELVGGEIIIGGGAEITGKTVHIGGEYQGKGKTPTAQHTTVEKGATIHAENGEVIIWADKHTQMDGNIHAKGGFVETSGKQTLGILGSVEAKDWLLDPNNITISGAADANVTASPNFDSTNDNAVVQAASINAALNAGTSVTIQTTSSGANTQGGNITVSSAISKTAGGDATLTLKADNNITVNAGISSTSGKLNTILWADKDNSGVGGIQINNSITSNGGNIVMAGGLDDGSNSGTATDGIPDGYATGFYTGGSYTETGVFFGGGATISSGTGNIILHGKGEPNSTNTYSTGIRLHGGSLTTTSGNINILGYGGTSATMVGGGMGVYIPGPPITTQTGNINITAIGSNSTLNPQGAMLIQNGTIIRSTGTGTSAGSISLTATTDPAVSVVNAIRIHNGVQITSVDAPITISATNNSPGSTNGYGLLLDGTAGVASISSTGTGATAGNISITGRGGGGGSNNYGVYAHGSLTTISAADGDISINGTGGNGTNLNYGTFIGSSVNTTTTGDGNITLTGTSGSGGTNYGLYFWGNISTGNGNISLSGTAYNTGRSMIADTGSQFTSTGSGTFSAYGTCTPACNSVSDIFFRNATVNMASGDITLQGNTTSFTTSTFTSGGNIILKPRTASTTVGVAGGAGVMQIDAAALAMMNAGNTLTIGDAADSAAMTVNGYAGWNSDVKLLSGNGVISVNGAQALGANDFTLQSDADPLVAAAVTGTGSLTFLPATAGTTMGLAGAAGTFNLSSAEMNFFSNTHSHWYFGNSSSAGFLTSNAYSWGDPVDFVTSGGAVFDGAVSADSILVNTTGGATGDIILNSALSASAMGDAITLATGRNFINNAGASALSAPAGRWLVYSTDPAQNTQGGLASNFLRFSCTYGGACPALGSGNGFLYRFAPSSGGGGGAAATVAATPEPEPVAVVTPEPTPEPVIPALPVVDVAFPAAPAPVFDVAADLPRINDTAPTQMIASTGTGAESTQHLRQDTAVLPKESANGLTTADGLLTYSHDLLVLLDCTEQSDASCKALQ